MIQKHLQIAFCGARGTGRSTIARNIRDAYNIHHFGSLRGRWKSFGVSDFELLPKDIRTRFQIKMLNLQIEKENASWEKGFITERSVLDYLAYTIISSDMRGDILNLYRNMIYDRMHRYSHVIYFPPSTEKYSDAILPAKIPYQDKMAAVLEQYLVEWLGVDKFIRVSGSIDDCITQINTYINYS